MATKTRTMTAGHKEALAEGRKLSKKLNAALKIILAAAAPKKRGRSRSAESIQSTIDGIELKLVGADPLKKVALLQQRIDLKNELSDLQASAASSDDVTQARLDFAVNAKQYSQKNGITYGAWREIGITAELLKEAGITRS